VFVPQNAKTRDGEPGLRLRYDNAAGGYPHVNIGGLTNGIVQPGNKLGVVESQKKGKGGAAQYKVVRLPDNTVVSEEGGPDTLKIYVNKDLVQRGAAGAAQSIYGSSGANIDARDFYKEAGSGITRTNNYDRLSQDYKVKTAQNRSLLFYHSNEPFYEFTNFWSHDPFDIILVRDNSGQPEPGVPTRWNTVEHAYQALKFINIDPQIMFDLHQSTGAMEAYKKTRDYKDRHGDYALTLEGKGPGCYHSIVDPSVAMIDGLLEHKPLGLYIKDIIMWNLLVKKFENPTLRQLLLSTYPHKIEENAVGPTNGKPDSYWGNGGTLGSGKNILGKMLTELRRHIQEINRGTSGRAGFGMGFELRWHPDKNFYVAPAGQPGSSPVPTHVTQGGHPGYSPVPTHMEQAGPPGYSPPHVAQAGHPGHWGDPVSPHVAQAGQPGYSPAPMAQAGHPGHWGDPVPTHVAPDSQTHMKYKTQAVVAGGHHMPVDIGDGTILQVVVPHGLIPGQEFEFLAPVRHSPASSHMAAARKPQRKQIVITAPNAKIKVFDDPRDAVKGKMPNWRDNAIEGNKYWVDTYEDGSARLYKVKISEGDKVDHYKIYRESSGGDAELGYINALRAAPISMGGGNYHKKPLKSKKASYSKNKKKLKRKKNKKSKKKKKLKKKKEKTKKKKNSSQYIFNTSSSRKKKRTKRS